MSRRACEQHILAAQRRDAQLRKAEEAKERVRFYTNGDAARHHEAWTTSEYYDKAKKDAEQLALSKIKAAKLEERRKKLEMMLFHENLQYQEELKTLSSKPKLFKNGSYLNAVPTSALSDINQGIKAKEEEMRRREAELRLYHSWRASQPVLRDAEARIRSGALKSAWMEQIVEKELEKKKEEEDTKRQLVERDQYIQKQIELEEQKLKQKEQQMKELKSGLESQIAELQNAESEVDVLRKIEDRETRLLDQLRFINEEHAREHARLMSARGTALVNLALHRHRLKLRAAQVRSEVDLDADMLQRMWAAIAEEYRENKKQMEESLRLVEAAKRSLEEQKEIEEKRRQLIDSMLDGEARQIREKQDKLWAKEAEARQSLLSEVMSTLSRQVSERLEASRERQRQSVLERERMLDEVERCNRDVRQKETEKQYQISQYGGITALQAELKGLHLERERLEEKQTEEAAARAAVQEEELVRQELVRLHRDGANMNIGKRRIAW